MFPDIPKDTEKFTKTPEQEYGHFKVPNNPISDIVDIADVKLSQKK